MEGYFQERFEAQRRLAARIADLMEVNDILEVMRSEIRGAIPLSMECCILLLDPDAKQYTRPLQCALYDRPVNCLSCKRTRSAIQKAIERRKGVVASAGDSIARRDGTRVPIGPEAAMPVVVEETVLAVVSVVAQPGARFTRKDFLFICDYTEAVRNILTHAKRHWVMTREKIRISQMLAHLSPFVPQEVRNIVEKNPELLDQGKEKLAVTVLFLDLEGYTRLSANRPETEVNDMVEKIFSKFVDPIHRSHGDINETAGDGLMIIFKDADAETNAVHGVKAAFDIYELNRQLQPDMEANFGPINVNMGINSGTALVGMTRFKGVLETRMTYTATGPVTNLAARLAAHASGGDIVIGEETRKLIHGLWPVHDHGLASLKGIDGPVRIYSLLR